MQQIQTQLRKQAEQLDQLCEDRQKQSKINEDLSVRITQMDNNTAHTMNTLMNFLHQRLPLALESTGENTNEIEVTSVHHATTAKDSSKSKNSQLPKTPSSKVIQGQPANRHTYLETPPAATSSSQLN